MLRAEHKPPVSIGGLSLEMRLKMGHLPGEIPWLAVHRLDVRSFQEPARSSARTDRSAELARCGVIVAPNQSNLCKMNMRKW